MAQDHTAKLRQCPSSNACLSRLMTVKILSSSEILHKLQDLSAGPTQVQETRATESLRPTYCTSSTAFTDPITFPVIRNRYCLLSQAGYLTASGEFCLNPEFSSQWSVYEVACRMARDLSCKYPDLIVRAIPFQQVGSRWLPIGHEIS